MMHRDNSSTEWSVTESNIHNSSGDVITQETEQFSENLNSVSEINDNSLSHPFLIGLDRNFFEQGDDPKDVILIGNGGLKFDGAEIKIDGNPTSSQKSFLASGNYLISLVEPVTSVTWDQNNLRQIRFIRSDGADNESSNFFSCSVEPSSSRNAICNNDDEVVEQEETANVKEPFDLDSNFANNIGNRHAEIKSLNEKTLPLKKKAKMKGVKVAKFSPDSPSNLIAFEGDVPKADCDVGVSLEPSKTPRPKKRKAGKRRCCYSDSDMSDCEDSANPEIVAHVSYSSSNDLVDDLKLNKLIDEEFASIITAGFKEMGVNLLEELNSSLETEYSFQLLTFAFLLYFKKRPAYHYLRKVYDKKWPSVNHLHEWKSQVNSKTRQRKKIGKGKE